MRYDFPQGPHYEHLCLWIPINWGKKQATCKALEAAFSETYSTTFTNSMVRYGQQGGPTAGERKKNYAISIGSVATENEALKIQQQFLS